LPGYYIAPHPNLASGLIGLRPLCRYSNIKRAFKTRPKDGSGDIDAGV
jgi:hypothetical protein